MGVFDSFLTPKQPQSRGRQPCWHKVGAQLHTASDLGCEFYPAGGGG